MRNLIIWLPKLSDICEQDAAAQGTLQPRSSNLPSADPDKH